MIILADHLDSNLPELASFVKEVGFVMYGFLKVSASIDSIHGFTRILWTISED
jgi:hypothetical protein